jgi:hemoglobin
MASETLENNAMAKGTLIKSFVVGGYLTLLLCTGAVQAAEEQPTKSLYDRLGGVYPISVVVDTFIELLLVNDVLNANPAIKAARDRVPAAGLKYHVTALVCQQTGGPCKYTGRGMKESHAHLNISEKEWQAMLADFLRVLNNYGVPAKEQQELVAIVESTKKDIVVRK